MVISAMTSTELRNFWHRSPFVPFDIVITGRAKIHVPHPDFLAVSQWSHRTHLD
jgi:hypothetical protein